MPQGPETALESVLNALPQPDEVHCRLDEPGVLSIRGQGRTALLLNQGWEHGGAVLSVHVKRPSVALPRPSFDDLRYPLASSLGAAFAYWLGLGRAALVPTGVYEGCVGLLTAMAAVFWAMGMVSYYREARLRAAGAAAESLLDALGTTLHVLGARAVPMTDDPFRR